MIHQHIAGMKYLMQDLVVLFTTGMPQWRRMTYVRQAGMCQVMKSGRTEIYLGMTREQADGTVWRGTDQGGKIKRSGTDHWVNQIKGTTNESG